MMTVNVFSSTTADGILAAILAPFFMSLGFFIWDVRWTKVSIAQKFNYERYALVFSTCLPLVYMWNLVMLVIASQYVYHRIELSVRIIYNMHFH